MDKIEELRLIRWMLGKLGYENDLNAAMKYYDEYRERSKGREPLPEGPYGSYPGQNRR